MKFKFIPVLAVAVLAVSCASADKMAKMADQVKVKCTPAPVAVLAGQVQADVDVTCPEKYFLPKAIVEVTPVLVYEGGEEAMEVLKYQGEKVKNNYKVVRKAGSTVSEHLVFPYKEGMQKCSLELRGRATTNNGKKWVTLPTKVVADGTNITELLAKVCCCGKVGGDGLRYAPKADNYQTVVFMNPEGQIMYLINSSTVRSTELKGQSIKDFQAALAAATDNERETITGIQIIAAASPDGGVKRNATLSDQRKATALRNYKKVLGKQNKAVASVETTTESLGQDWEGFQNAVSNSSMSDKDLVLRVLGMYDDPAVREKEIRNMSVLYEELAKDVLPQLRRARFIATVKHLNYSNEEIKELMVSNPDALEEQALLRAATLTDDNALKTKLYTMAVNKYASEAAQYNLACMAVDANDLAAAKAALDKCNAGDEDVLNLKGVCAYRSGDIAGAKAFFAKSNAGKANLGTIAILEGKYKEAVGILGNKGCNAALANLLCGDLNAAAACLNGKDCPKANYIRAIIACRQGKLSDAKACLEKAKADSKDLAERAAKDIEFAAL